MLLDKYLEKIYVAEDVSATRKWYKIHEKELKEYVKKFKPDACSYLADETGDTIASWEAESDHVVIKALLQSMTVTKLNKMINYKY